MESDAPSLLSLPRELQALSLANLDSTDMVAAADSCKALASALELVPAWNGARKNAWILKTVTSETSSLSVTRYSPPATWYPGSLVTSLNGRPYIAHVGTKETCIIDLRAGEIAAKTNLKGKSLSLAALMRTDDKLFLVTATKSNASGIRVHLLDGKKLKPLKLKIGRVDHIPCQTATLEGQTYQFAVLGSQILVGFNGEMASLSPSIADAAQLFVRAPNGLLSFDIDNPMDEGIPYTHLAKSRTLPSPGVRSGDARRWAILSSEENLHFAYSYVAGGSLRNETCLQSYSPSDKAPGPFVTCPGSKPLELRQIEQMLYLLTSKRSRLKSEFYVSAVSDFDDPPTTTLTIEFEKEPHAIATLLQVGHGLYVVVATSAHIEWRLASSGEMIAQAAMPEGVGSPCSIHVGMDRGMLYSVVVCSKGVVTQRFASKDDVAVADTAHKTSRIGKFLSSRGRGH